MGDDRFREAERRWRESALPHDEARYLAELVRAGRLRREKVALAATLGYEPAAMALGRPVARSHSLLDTFAALEPFGRETLVRAATVFARRLSRPWSPDMTAVATLEAVELWTWCPCDEHRGAVERFPEEEPATDRRLAAFRLAVRMAVECLLGAPWTLSRWPASYARERDAVIAAAIRADLVPWALDPHPVRLHEGTRGELLLVRAGSEGSALTWRYLVDSPRFTIGSRDDMELNVEGLAPHHAEVVREGDKFVVRSMDFSTHTYISEREVLRAYIASGEVICAGPLWIEVRVLAPPYEHDVIVAREEAPRFERRASAEARLRLMAAAACGHLGASLAAASQGISLRPRFDVKAWAATLRRLPPEPSARAAALVACEALPVWRRVFGDDALERGFEAGDERALGEMLRRRKPQEPTVTEQAALAAGSAVYGALAAAREGGEELTGVVAGALDAGVAAERVFTLLRESILSWALADRPGI